MKFSKLLFFAFMAVPVFGFGQSPEQDIPTRENGINLTSAFHAGYLVTNFSNIDRSLRDNGFRTLPNGHLLVGAGLALEYRKWQIDFFGVLGKSISGTGSSSNLLDGRAMFGYPFRFNHLEIIPSVGVGFNTINAFTGNSTKASDSLNKLYVQSNAIQIYNEWMMPTVGLSFKKWDKKRNSYSALRIQYAHGLKGSRWAAKVNSPLPDSPTDNPGNLLLTFEWGWKW